MSSGVFIHFIHLRFFPLMCAKSGDGITSRTFESILHTHHFSWISNSSPSLGRFCLPHFPLQAVMQRGCLIVEYPNQKINIPRSDMIRFARLHPLSHGTTICHRASNIIHSIVLEVPLSALLVPPWVLLCQLLLLSCIKLPLSWSSCLQTNLWHV
jgi:hypothetical protein